MPRRPKLPPMPPSGDARSFSAIGEIQRRITRNEARIDEHEERLDIDDERLDGHEAEIDHHRAMIAEVERDLATLKQVGVRLVEREHARLVRRRRSHPRSDRG